MSHIRNVYIKDSDMKRFISIFFAAMCIAGCGMEGSKDIVLTFNVNEKASNEVVVVYHNEIKTVALDAQGVAELVISDQDAVYARLYHYPDVGTFKSLYLERGDNVNISFNGRDLAGSFVFDGEKAKAVEYLNTVKLTALPDEDYALPFDEYMKKIEVKEQDALKLLKANGLKSIGDFEEIEAGRIRYSFGNQLLMYPFAHRFMAGDSSYEPDQAYYDLIDSYLVDDELWADLDQFRDFVAEAAHVLDVENRNLRSAYPKTVAQMRFIADRFESEKVRNTLLHGMAYAYVDRYGVDDIQDMENIYRTYVKDTVLTAKYDKVREKWNLASTGKLSPDFKAVDLAGKEYSLADFAGKYVYIDLWATWCGPCRQELPHLKALEEKYEDAQIVFVSISVDSDKDKWEKMVKIGTMSGVQLYLGSKSSFLDAYKVSAIPRFILLDKEGRIIDKEMSRPSDPATADFIGALEGIR